MTTVLAVLAFLAFIGPGVQGLTGLFNLGNQGYVAVTNVEKWEQARQLKRKPPTVKKHAPKRALSPLPSSKTPVNPSTSNVAIAPTVDQWEQPPWPTTKPIATTMPDLKLPIPRGWWWFWSDVGTALLIGGALGLMIHAGRRIYKTWKEV